MIGAGCQKDGVCSIEGCGKDARTRGMCIKHYSRVIRYGSPHFVRKVGNGEALAWLQAAASHDGTDCLVWPFHRMANGYGQVRFNGRTRVASNVMCELVQGPAPEGKAEAAHSCGNGHLGCVNPRHVRWASHQENVADQFIHDTTIRGERSPHAKLTESDVRFLRSIRGRVSLRKLATKYGVSPACLQAAASGKTWAWLK